jgi:hypothetical protein
VTKRPVLPAFFYAAKAVEQSTLFCLFDSGAAPVVLKSKSFLVLFFKKEPLSSSIVGS